MYVPLPRTSWFLNLHFLFWKQKLSKLNTSSQYTGKKIFLRENQSWKPTDRWWVHDVVEAVDDVAHNRVAARWFRDFQALWRLPLPNHVLQNGQRQSHKDSYGFHGNFCEAELGSCHSPIMFYRTNRDRVIKTADLFTRMILVYFVNLNFQHTKLY